MQHIVKRKGHTEPFDQRKIYASVYSSCIVLRMSDEEAELLADTVTKDVVKALSSHTEVSSREIHKNVVESLERYNPDAAYLYDTHKDLS